VITLFIGIISERQEAARGNMKGIRAVIRITILIIVFLISVSSCSNKESKTAIANPAKQVSAIPENFDNGRAVSLKVLQEKTEECMAKGACPASILQICDIKKIAGYVIDEKSGDIILNGKIDDTSPPLYLEDFVIALRNTWMKYAERKEGTYYYSNPGCSIDPDPTVLNNLQEIAGRIFSKSNSDSVKKDFGRWRNVCGRPQTVRVMGIPYDSHFAKVMVDADYYMKRLVDGSETLGIDGFTSLTDMTLNIVRKEIEDGKPISVPLSSMNRFWFYPGENSFFEDKGVIYFKKSDVILLNEEEFLTKMGELAGAGRPNLLAQRFANNFSARYSEIAKARLVYAELEGLFRFVALSRILKYRKALSEAGINLDYLMNQFPVQDTHVERTLPGISNIKEFSNRKDTKVGYEVLYLWLPSCGGVEININVKEDSFVLDKTGGIANIRKAIIKARPSADSLYWKF